MTNVAYFDTSALLKKYVTEIGSDWVQAYLTSLPMPTVFTSSLTVVEAVCAFSRRLREGILMRDAYTIIEKAFDYDAQHKYNLLDVNPTTLETARQLAKSHPLRAYDAMHLATAQLVNRQLTRIGKPPLTFVCADDRLLAVAQVEGLLIQNPNQS